MVKHLDLEAAGRMNSSNLLGLSVAVPLGGPSHSDSRPRRAVGWATGTMGNMVQAQTWEVLMHWAFWGPLPPLPHQEAPGNLLGVKRCGPVSLDTPACSQPAPRNRATQLTGNRTQQGPAGGPLG